ncbi:MAG: MBL fold metallo-hydrolase [Xanthomonadales bacterium]|nr:MBL fold metallo-hydrolase [Gammaproteobacteria bacterium]MBT8052913.1 MBL fold metallo-hydrolase [Gammaproteobacteria bacterium]NND56196.1 MBL fold metallo-hydrolase [Xanthomonadales bacterium]NNK51558.1 MBL fold metallo-hydrolase [Xanthomonadales bacterium]
MNIKYPFALVAALLLSTTIDAAESLPLQSLNKAGEVIDAAVEAHGGAETIAGLHTLVQESTFTNFATGQSRKPGPPYDQGHQTTFNAIDTENGWFVTRNKGEGGGYIFDQGVIINGEDSWQLNHRSGTAAPMASPDFNTQSGPFVRVTPALLMKQLQARRDASNWLGETEIEGRLHDVITLVMETGPALGLYIDRETRMLTRMERVLPPFGQIEYRFLDYTEIDGIAFNQKFRLYANGEENLLINIQSTRVNAPLDGYLVVPENLERVAAVAPDELSTQEIGEGVFLIGGNATYALFVEMEDHVVAIGGTQTVPVSIAEMRKQITDKPIKYGVLTHHHSDHVPGAAAYAEEGATIITFKENEAVVRKAAADENAKLEFVEDRMTLTDGNRTIVLYNIGPTPHAENMLVAYLPDQGILFEADHFPQPANGVIPPAVPATLAFAERLDELGIRYTRLVGAHSPRIGSPADLQAALERARVLSAGAP